jgi:hypothetical protein
MRVSGSVFSGAVTLVVTVAVAGVTATPAAALAAMPAPLTAPAAVTVGQGDLFAVGTDAASGQTEVHVLSRATGFTTYDAHAATGLGATDLSRWTFDFGDYDGDGIPDLYAIDTRADGGKNTEVHVYSGASGFQNGILHERLPSLGGTHLSTWAYAVGDYNGDGHGDVYAIDTKDDHGKETTVRVYDASTGMSTTLMHAPLPSLPGTSLSTWQFAVGDYDGDGHADLFAVNTHDSGGQDTAVHVFNAVTGFATVLLDQKLQLASVPLSQWQFAVTDADGDGRADLVAVNSNDPNTHGVAVHPLSAGSALTAYIGHDATPLAPVSLSTWQFHGWTTPRHICGSGPGAGTAVTRWNPVVVCVLGMLGLPNTPDLISDVDIVITGESSGNPNSINTWDSNARAGHPSSGLVQVIGPTFDEWHSPNLPDDIWDPAANIYAGMNYGIHRYGSIPQIPGVASVLAGGRYLPY